jgi:hypothetical protein
VVFDVDERICGAITHFADKERLSNLTAAQYNCIDALPGPNNFEVPKSGLLSGEHFIKH